MNRPANATTTAISPAVNARTRKRSRSINGAAVRRSTITNTTPSPRASASSATTGGLVQPIDSPWLSASRSANRLPAVSTAPGRSNGWRCPGRSAGRTRAAHSIAKIPTGRLTRKIARHVPTSVRMPPSAGPRLRPIATLTALRPSAFPRSPGPKVRAMIAGPIAISAAAPTPWTALEATSATGPGAAPQRTLATVKIAKPAR